MYAPQGSPNFNQLPKRLLEHRDNIKISWHDGYEEILKEDEADFISLNCYLSTVVAADPERQKSVRIYTAPFTYAHKPRRNRDRFRQLPALRTVFGFL